MAHSPVRWGILATGNIAESFAADLALLPDAELVAVGSRTPSAAQGFAQRHAIPNAYGSWTELAADQSVDVVYVATPHSSHLEASLVCLNGGRAVLCEKPLTLDRPSAEQLFAAARTAGVFCMEAMWMRTNPTIRRVQEVIADGAIGDITYISASFGIPGPFAPEHRLRAKALGGGALLDLGVYPVTFAHVFLGVPASVHATASLTPEGCDQNTAVVLGYDSGALASLHCGFVGASGQTAEIVGTTGRIELPNHFYRPTGYTLIRAGHDPERVDLPLRGTGFTYEAEEVMRCLREGLTESPVIPHAATLDVMSTLDEARAQVGVTYP